MKSNQERAKESLASLNAVRDEIAKLLTHEGPIDVCLIGLNLGKIRKALEAIRDAKE